MKLHFFLLSFFFTGVLPSIYSQLPSGVPGQNYSEIHQSLVLLKNEGDLIPFKNIGKTSFSHVSLGTPFATSAFYHALEKYKEIKNFHLKEDISGTAAGEIFKYLVNHSDVVIFSVHVDTNLTLSPVIREFIRDLEQHSHIAFVLFGQNDLVASFSEFYQAKSILHTPHHYPLAQSLAAQICFGAFGAEGRLTADMLPYYKKGTGITSTGGLRLSYGPPEWKGVNTDTLKDKINQAIQLGLDSMAFPGGQLLIAKDGQVILQTNFGFHTYEQKKAVLPTDLYDLASVTKVTTALPALMQLQDAGLFSVDAQLQDYFPDFRGSNKASLYFRSILAHNAQLKPYIVYWQKARRKNGKYKWRTFKKKPGKNFTVKITDQLYLHKRYKHKIVKAIRKSPLMDKPGYLYSGLSFLIYPDLIQSLTGNRLDDYLYQNIYRPIGADRLLFTPLERVPKEEIVPTELDDFFRMQLVHGNVHDEAAAMLNGISSNAGLFGNANDLAKLLQLYLNNGAYGGERFIEKTTLKEYTQCQFCEQGNRRGLGFDKPPLEYDEQKSYIAQSASKDSYGHSGFTGTFFWVDPAEALIVILLTNRVHPTRDNRKLYTLKIREQVHQAVYDAIYEYKGQTQKDVAR